MELALDHEPESDDDAEMDFCATIGAEIDHLLERATAEAENSSHSSGMTRESFSPSSPDYSPRSPSPNLSFDSMDKVSIDTFMEDEGEIANISGSFHLDDDSRNHIEYRPSDITINICQQFEMIPCNEVSCCLGFLLEPTRPRWKGLGVRNWMRSGMIL